MRREADTSASGGAYVRVPPGKSEDKPGTLELRFLSPAEGPYVIWGRVRADKTSQNSFFMTLDGGDEEIWDIEPTPDWTWDALRPRGAASPFTYLDQGEHVLRLREREAGARLDGLLITSDLEYRP